MVLNSADRSIAIPDPAVRGRFAFVDVWPDLEVAAAQRFNPELRAYYEEKRAQGKHSMVVTDAVARRLVHMIYSVWSQNRPFAPDYRWTPPGSSQRD
ncbi:MAG: hypothetical protein M0Z94_16110 [Dehalococcoidales bacterium]|nr:hypothetical protein [Dehalococcoidales bacterium]